MDRLLLSVISHLLTIPFSFFINCIYCFPFSNIYAKEKFIRFIVATLFYFAFHFLFFLIVSHYAFTDFSNHFITTILSSILNFFVLKLFVFKITSKITTNGADRITIIPHADDFGVATEISQNILDCVSNGSISRVSMICNTNTFLQDELSKHSTALTYAFHINLVEGKPISNKLAVSSLLNENGEFKSSFFTYTLRYYFSSNKNKKILRNEVKIEIESQLKKYQELTKNKEIHIDGHTHIHMIPFILNIIIQLKKQYNIKSIRLPREKFYFGAGLRDYFSSNLIKHLVLNILSEIQIRKIKKEGFKHNDYLIGILSTGSMSVSSLTNAVDSLSRKKQNMIVEILFHPGFVNDRNNIEWTKNNIFIDYYSNFQRIKEKEMLFSKEYKCLLNTFHIVNRL
ncbi:MULTISPECIES: carbohydrate deacetylase [unclassified Sphingobacterium]|uniref:carbohydrate deacetylase n=1 Tax=unclassified Sphingobacterium TaxID=2609468 RepID=UPI001404D22D|nr:MULTISPECIES: ChbG/HpnK family deacetylase [unclassified Sphingobacterium]MCS3556220.1 putative glycoside hydrolase/deacetylase ChbG (UPF0249 family) [Sphingobacterium sp. JUb21]